MCNHLVGASWCSVCFHFSCTSALGECTCTMYYNVLMYYYLRFSDRFDLSLHPTLKVEHKMAAVMKTENGMYMLATPRKVDWSLLNLIGDRIPPVSGYIYWLFCLHDLHRSKNCPYCAVSAKFMYSVNLLQGGRVNVCGEGGRGGGVGNLGWTDTSVTGILKFLSS